MDLAINTDFLRGTGDPEPFLRTAAAAGFTHLHWCHQWCTDFLYGRAEITAIMAMLQRYGLKLLDIHGAVGPEKCWYSTMEYRRQAGVESVTNRLEMLAELGGCGVVMMHIPNFSPRQTPEARSAVRPQVEALKRSLDELMPLMDRLNTAIALENMWADDFVILEEFLCLYPAERIGLCYDSGHGNARELPADAMIDRCRDRIRALHLHDNDGKSDLHQPPFMNTVDWDRQAELIAASSYSGPLSFEIAMRNTPYFKPELDEQKPEDIAAFLHDAYQRCRRFAGMTMARKP